MPATQIRTTLSNTDRETVMAAVNTIKEKLPFLVDLNAEERKALPKMGDKSHGLPGNLGRRRARRERFRMIPLNPP